jgi:hypothetical protein
VVERCTQGKSSLIHQLREIVESKGVDAEIESVLDQLKFQLGSAGKERRNALEYFFN